MANFKGKIRTIGDKLYKKDRTIENRPTTINPIPMECDVYIPNLNQLDLTQFLKAVDPKDNSRVFYCKTVDTTNKISILESGTNITFFNASNMDGKIYSNNSMTNGINPAEYVFAPPYSGDGTTSNRFNGLYAFNLFDTQGGPGSLAVNFEILADYIFDANDNVDVRGLEGYKSNDDDSLVMPGTKTTINLETTPGIILCDDEYFPALRGSCKTSLISDYVDGATNYWSANSQVFGQLYMFGKNGKVTANLPIGRIGGKNNNQIDPYISNGSSGFCIFCLFLDDNGEYWIMTLNPDNSGAAISRVYVTLTKAKNIYTKRTSQVSNVEGELRVALQYLDESSFGSIDKFFQKIVSIDKESGSGDYGEDGPDIIGPGDVYEDILNNSNVQQVGGRPNIQDDITKDQAHPNTGIDKFRIKSGYFGSYELTENNLKQYSDTLSACYEHANDLLFGWVAKDVANIIKDNTNNVIMLPFDIPSANKIEAPFSVGNNLIAGKLEVPIDYDRWAGTALLPVDNYATANLITKEMTEFVINIGTIPHYYDNFLDFPPYSEGKMYIPYIGTVSIPLDMMQSTSDEQKNIELLIRCNNTNGDILALLRVDGKTLNHWTGNCARGIQINVQDNSDIIRDGANRIIGALAPAIGAAIPSQHFSSVIKPVIEDTYEYNPKTMENELVGSSNRMMKDTYSYEHTNVPSPSPSTNTLPNIPSVHAISNSSPSGGAIGYMDSQDIILTIYRPVVWKPFDYGGTIGFPTKRIAKLSSIEGFARVSELHLKCSATSSEKNEIISLLSGGVLFDEN